MDNDSYGHVNNVVYAAYFDTVINAYLIREGGLDIHDGKIIGVCAESACRYKAAFAFPEEVEAGLRVGHLGNRSVRYAIGLFKQDRAEAAALGSFVHVFVEVGRASGRERVCQYVSISGVGVSLQNNNKNSSESRHKK